MAPSARNMFRLFVAIYPPTEIARELVAALSRLDLPDYRPVPVEQVHMTLQFIGDTPAPQLDQTKETVLRSTGGVKCFDLQPRLLIKLPERGPARLIAAEATRPPGLVEVHRRLAARSSSGRECCRCRSCCSRSGSARVGEHHAANG